jgi:hypothetical protein
MRMKTSIVTTFDTEEQSIYKKVRDSKAPWIQFVPDAEKARMQKLQCSVVKYPAFNFTLTSNLADFCSYHINKRLRGLTNDKKNS